MQRRSPAESFSFINNNKQFNIILSYSHSEDTRLNGTIKRTSRRRSYSDLIMDGSDSDDDRGENRFIKNVEKLTFLLLKLFEYRRWNVSSRKFEDGVQPVINYNTIIIDDSHRS